MWIGRVPPTCSLTDFKSEILFTDGYQNCNAYGEAMTQIILIVILLLLLRIITIRCNNNNTTNNTLTWAQQQQH